jgi:thioesterase domain-containing protein
MTGDTASSMIEMLTPIWERVLRHSPISTDDNFFDLGGDSRSAQELTSQVAQTWGLELPPAAICYAPTISALAAMLERPEASPLPPLVLLKSGMPRSGFADSEKPPVLITHGIGGSTLDLVKLARKIETPQAIYGMQTRGLDGIEEPFDRIEDIAQGYIDALEQIQPHGPYFLIGYSLGGLVTLEMAQRLRAKGEKIAILAMLDSYPDTHQLSPGQRALLTLRLGRRRIATILDSAFHHRQSQVLQPETGIHNLPSSSLARASKNVRQRSYAALRHYRPRFFDGTMKFVSAGITTNFPENPVAVWAHLTREFQVETAPGNHLEMLTLHFETLASILSRYLKETS